MLSTPQLHDQDKLFSASEVNIFYSVFIVTNTLHFVLLFLIYTFVMFFNTLFYATLQKISWFHLISRCENFVEKNSFHIISGNSGNSLETMRKLFLSTKFPHQEIRWSYGIFCSTTWVAIAQFFNIAIEVIFAICVNHGPWYERGKCLSVRMNKLFVNKDIFRYLSWVI